jgi:hypothetical protein
MNPFRFQPPTHWLAVRCSSPDAVRSALGLRHVLHCSWTEGLCEANHHRLFITPPIKGWVLVFGHSLPEPADDVDACFRFLTGLSRRLGHVQLFISHWATGHHAWARANHGRVVRAYAWAEETLWNQGTLTPAERELGLRCRAYGEEPGLDPAALREEARANCEQMPLLAARWSLDPEAISWKSLDRRPGIAGAPSLRTPD